METAYVGLPADRAKKVLEGHRRRGKRVGEKIRAVEEGKRGNYQKSKGEERGEPGQNRKPKIRGKEKGQRGMKVVRPGRGKGKA